MGVGTVDLHLGVPDTALTCTGWPDISVTVQAHDIDRACCRAQLLQVATGVTTIAVAIGATLPEGRPADGDSHPRSSGRAVPPVNHNRTPAELRAALARDTWGFPERQHIQREADSATPEPAGNETDFDAIAAQLRHFKKDTDFIQAHWGGWKEKYPDHYVLVYDEKLVSASTDLKEAIRLAESQGVDPGHAARAFFSTDTDDLILGSMANLYQ